MAVIGEIAINVAANVSKAITNVGKFRTGVNSLSGSMGKSLGAMSGFSKALTGIGASLSAGAFATTLKRRIDDIDGAQ